MAEKDGYGGHTAPTEFTIRSNGAVRESLPLDDPEDFEDAKRGLIASDPSLQIMRANGKPAWDMTAYEFLEGDSPTSVNPSLWRQAQLNSIHGLFEVTQGIYQVRGYDISNLTIIDGKSGWIIVDPMIAMETTEAAFELVKKHLGPRPVVAIIHTHSHVDHFGGILSLVSSDDVANGNVRVIAPEGFLEEAVSEAIIAGPAMLRRGQFMYGRGLSISERGHVDTGLGKGIPTGRSGILVPTETVNTTPQEMEIDGIRFVFQNAPESEAPAELTFYLPDLKAYCGGEIVSKNLHNVYTLRGTKARDALKWSNYIDEAIDLFGDAAIYFGTHHWPVWGNGRVIEFLKKQRDIYKYIHDQTLRLANSGFTPREIAEQMTYPDSLRTTFSNRGYYGTLQHNAKAVYTYYFGWYDGNPATLNPLPPEEAGKRYVEYMGGGDTILGRAQESYDGGDYRWVAEVLNHLVFAEPENERAKELLASAYDQLGYQSESGPWRDVYLTAALELRQGAPKGTAGVGNAAGMIAHMPVSKLFDAMCVRLDGPASDGKVLSVNVCFSDRQETYVLTLENAVLHYKKSTPDPDANATLNLTYACFLRIATGQMDVSDAAATNEVEIAGSLEDLVELFSLLKRPQGFFNIVTP